MSSTSQSEYSDIFNDRIYKLTLIAKLLNRKFEEFTNHVSRQQSSSAALSVELSIFTFRANILDRKIEVITQ